MASTEDETAIEQVARWRRMMMMAAYTEDHSGYNDEYLRAFLQYLTDGTVTDALAVGETNGGYVIPAWRDDGAH